MWFLAILLKIVNLVLGLAWVNVLLWSPGLWVFERYNGRFRWPPHYFWIVVLTVAGILGYATFWIFLFSTVLGKIWSLGLTIFALRYLFARRRQRFGLDQEKWLALALLNLTVIFYSGILFTRAPAALSQEPAKDITSWRLPHDNVIPYRFGEKVYVGENPTDMGSYWKSSDRPPLQTGVWLWVKPLFDMLVVNGLGYHVLACVLQATWVLTLLTFAKAYRFSRRQTWGTYLFCLFSGFFLVNTVYVWPKLIAGTFCLFTALILLWRENRRVDLVLAGTCAGLAMLSHGGSAFFLLVLLPYWTLTRSRFSLVNIASVALPILLLQASWGFYQRAFDPPGNRLLKMHFAGVESIDSRSTMEAIRDAYTQTPSAVIIGNKIANTIRPFYLLGLPYGPNTSPGDIQGVQFFELFSTLDILLLGVVVALFGVFMGRSNLGKRLRQRTVGDYLLLWVMTYLFWTGLMFSGNSAIIHVGTYVLPMLMFFGLSAVLIAGLNLWFIPLLILHAGIFFYGWVVFKNFAPGGEAWAVVSILALGLIFYVLRKPFFRTDH